MEGLNITLIMKSRANSMRQSRGITLPAESYEADWDVRDGVADEVWVRADYTQWLYQEIVGSALKRDRL